LGSNRAALNRVLRRQERIREAEWLAEHLEPQPSRNPAVEAAEEEDIKRRRDAFGLY